MRTLNLFWADDAFASVAHGLLAIELQALTNLGTETVGLHRLEFIPDYTPLCLTFDIANKFICRLIV